MKMLDFYFQGVNFTLIRVILLIWLLIDDCFDDLSK